MNAAVVYFTSYFRCLGVLKKKNMTNVVDEGIAMYPGSLALRELKASESISNIEKIKGQIEEARGSLSSHDANVFVKFVFLEIINREYASTLDPFLVSLLKMASSSYENLAVMLDAFIRLKVSTDPTSIPSVYEKLSSQININNYQFSILFVRPLTVDHVKSNPGLYIPFIRRAYERAILSLSSFTQGTSMLK